MPSGSDLFSGLMISALGSAYMLYGRRQSNPLALISGLALLVLPMVASDMTARLLIALLLLAIPWVAARR